MMRRVSFAYAGLLGGAALGITSLLAAWPALSSAPGPQLKLSATNAVPACFTPAKLMQHVARANGKLDPRLREVAGLYESHGQKLGLRWDYAFFQMLAETNNLSFSGAGVKGELTAAHNNFASIRSVDGDEPDRFPDISTGVLAHLHHIRLYAGDPVAKPAAKRTKQVESFILNWSRQLKRPVRFDDMISRWSPNNPGYARTIETAMKEFQVTHCGGVIAPVASDDDEPPTRAKDGKDTRKKLAKLSESDKKSKRGSRKAGDDDEAPEAATAKEPAADVSEPIRTAGAANRAGKPTQPAPLGLGLGQAAMAGSAGAGAGAAQAPAETVKTAAAAAGAASGAAGSSSNCKVWSASFGGDKSVLIRVLDGPVTHFTALQVNAGREKEETTAYIAAYARGGKSVGEFQSADQAINTAFELCPKT